MLYRTIQMGTRTCPAFEVDAADILICQSLRAERDRLYGNIFEVHDSDLRWVGELGELAFRTWMQIEKIQHTWHLDPNEAAGNRDFTVNRRGIGLKTVKRKVYPRPDYTSGITARHVEEPIDSYFFTCFNTQTNVIVLMGGCSKHHFIDHARYHGAGDKVHDHYTIRPGHEIYNIKNSDLVAPMTCLQAMKRPALAAA